MVCEDVRVFFPDCIIPDCTYSQQVHQHIWPKQQEILDASTKYLYAQGGVGSAKSLAFAVKSVWLSLTIPENVGVVTRKDFKLLYKSSWLDIKKVIERLVKKGIIEQPIYSDKRQGDYTTIQFKENNSVIYAMQGKNWSEGLGANYGWFWVDDAMESAEEMFVGDETNAGLLSRLRLPHVHFNKQTFNSDTRNHGSLHGMVSTNPPYFGHYLHKLFGKNPGVHSIGDDEVTWIQTSTTENLAVGADYAKGLIAIQSKMGRSEGAVRRIIFGDSVPAYSGIAVYPQFEHGKHVAPLKYNKDLPLIRAWDFGFRHPAVLFANLYTCEYKTHHYLCLSEVSDCFNATVYELYDNYVKKMTRDLYNDAVLVLDCGDQAGFRGSSSNKDKRSDMKILIAEYNLLFKYRRLDLAPSLQYCRGLLQPKKACLCGLELVLISNECQVLIGALEGGYKYSKTREGKVSDKPVEDCYFADIACAWRYGAENFVKWGIPREEQSYVREQRQRSQKHTEVSSWMNMDDRAFAKMLTS